MFSKNSSPSKRPKQLSYRLQRQFGSSSYTTDALPKTYKQRRHCFLNTPIFLRLRPQQPNMFQEISQTASRSHLPVFPQKRKGVAEYHRTCRLDTNNPQSLLHVVGTSLKANLNR
ncbi:hypothetical protein CHARACLAT_024694 [Characodon lateralis]|uniref:Uncharacterized protein n=1 Tax=Characodon lateralis TaxID=208331 RepID=A0ABU7EZL5_9TELE|nr:hypothetical protein [Characodon lateralis]